MYAKPVKDFGESISARVASDGEQNCQKMDQAGAPLLAWLLHIMTTKLTGNADALVSGVHGAVIEATGAVVVGLARSSLFSMRAQIDMLLGWLYFKDHPMEWRRVEDTGDGFLLKTEAMKYLNEHYVKFGTRFAILKQAKARKEDEPYRLLSAHVHSQSTPTIPKHTKLTDLVFLPSLLLECIAIQGDVSEYLNDILLSCYASEWASIPQSIIAAAKTRLTPAQSKAFFA